MLNLNEIERHYPAELRPFKGFLLREYLQHRILETVFDSEYGNRLVFMGGTCLRIVHGNTRFSEDLDFDNRGLNSEDFMRLSGIISEKLKREGYEVSIRNVMKDAFHCHIRFPGLMFREGLSGHREQVILIQLDTEPQSYDYAPEQVILNRFDVFTEILSTPLQTLLSQKLYAILNRRQPKGRDFFDAVFLLGRTKPDYGYLKLKTGVDGAEPLRSAILERCNSINMKDMVSDVQKFLFYAEDAKKVLLFGKYFEQVAI